MLIMNENKKKPVYNIEATGDYHLPDDIITVYWEKFRARQDAYATRHVRDGSVMYLPECRNQFTRRCRVGKTPSPCSDCPYKQRAHVTNRVIREHLTGHRVHAFYPLLPGGTCRFGAIDLDDENDFFQMEEIDFYAKKLALSLCPATSTSKGYHLYVFLEEAMDARTVRRLLMHLCSEVGIHPLPEIFPKQTGTQTLGNPIRTPLTIPDMMYGRCAILNPQEGYIPFRLQDQWERLKTVKMHSADELEELVESVGIEEDGESRRSIPEDLPPVMKPCVERGLAEGTVQGRRNDAGIIIASELRKLGHDREHVLRLMSRWNQKNKPELTSPELNRIVQSAFHHAYSYGCRSESIKRVFGCSGLDRCAYYQRYWRKTDKSMIHIERGYEHAKT